MKQTMDKDILTTADTAKLLGVSVRTAQLLIEGGSLPSWKTPGGHRRVYRRDVEALVAGEGGGAPSSSARILAVVGDATGRDLEALFASVGEASVEFASDIPRALMAIGAARPYALIVEPDADGERADLVSGLLDRGLIAPERILVLGTGAHFEPANWNDRVRPVATAEAAVAAVRALLGGAASAQIAMDNLPFPVALNESQRLIALERSGLVDTAPEEAFDRIAWLAASTLDAPIALVTLITPTRQFFKARLGLEMTETPRSTAFCNHTIMQKGVFAVEDLREDERFAANPAVAGDPNFRFYAGAPIFSKDGFALGSLCIIDYEPRKLGAEEQRTLAELAALATLELRFRQTDQQLRDALRRAEHRSPVAERAAATRGSRPPRDRELSPPRAKRP